eukprot:scaffold130111_cov67-Phaeocystis_antarctica.AAC.3
MARLRFTGKLKKLTLLGLGVRALKKLTLSRSAAGTLSHQCVIFLASQPQIMSNSMQLRAYMAMNSGIDGPYPAGDGGTPLASSFVRLSILPKTEQPRSKKSTRRRFASSPSLPPPPPSPVLLPPLPRPLPPTLCGRHWGGLAPPVSPWAGQRLAMMRWSVLYFSFGWPRAYLAWYQLPDSSRACSKAVRILHGHGEESGWRTEPVSGSMSSWQFAFHVIFDAAASSSSFGMRGVGPTAPLAYVSQLRIAGSPTACLAVSQLRPVALRQRRSIEEGS